MRHLRLALWMLLIFLCACGSARAGWHEFWERFDLDWHRMNAWPEPFLTTDRQLERAPFCVMVNKGWQLQNTISDFHFNPETQELTRSGELKLQGILNDSPPPRRTTIFVLRGRTDDVTTARIASVQQAMSRISPQGPLPDVVQSGITPRSWPADYVDDINNKMIKSRPAPVLPASAGGGSN
jgi:hypothetical protein